VDPFFQRYNIPKSSAEWTYERLVLYIRDFEKNLDEEHEIGARLVSFGSELVFNIEYIGYHGPDIIAFSGKNKDGLPLQLIQHVSQLSVLLVAMKKTGEKAKRIGFQLTIGKEEDEK
jgi:Family of unknown function (DUF6173)